MAKTNAPQNRNQQTNKPAQQAQKPAQQSAPAAQQGAQKPMTQGTQAAAPQASANGTRTATLKLVNVQKNGIATYTEEGVGASVYFNKTMFSGAEREVVINVDGKDYTVKTNAPVTLTITAPSLTKAGENVRIGGGKKADPAKLKAKLEKSLQRQTKTAARNAKLAKRLAALGVTVDVPGQAAAAPAAEGAADAPATDKPEGSGDATS